MTMKILHLITRLIQGGAQQNTVMSCKAQVDAGHDVTLAFGPIFGPEGSLLDEAQESGCKILEIPSMVRSINPLKDALCYRAIRKHVQTEQYDLVHSHSSKAGILARAAAYNCSKSNASYQGPVVIHTVHGLSYHGVQSKFIHNLYIHLEREAAKHCHHIVAITPAMVESFVENNITTADKCTVIPSGVDLSRFQPNPNWRLDARKELNIPSEAPVIANLARLDALKGHDDLLDIYHSLAKDLGSETRLLFIGDGYNRPNIEAKIASYNLTDRVIITGYIPHKQIARTLSAADVKVLPSYQEGQSRTLVESLLLNIPIVAYEVGGIPSICQNDKTGRLVPLANKPALTDAIIDTFKNPEKTKKMTEQGRIYVTEKYSSKAMTDQLEILYQKLFNQCRQINATL